VLDFFGSAAAFERPFQMTRYDASDETAPSTVTKVGIESNAATVWLISLLRENSSFSQPANRLLSLLQRCNSSTCSQNSKTII
jgi:hypothetical protein